ncbi:hypothetical protein BO71DRAFT_331762 [Aspergillus ellipticus CBS 707.79]|uniref:Rhodopsin domain-containing protein n=1 Tax=Aspergillus ellipticus CBS 707.79 TaxID=1448320 RepID=A0A319D2B8_9EURO|nr:hypothetical protein BO71DRAFT_331762 [Aspergillus ellipticus CBS 707.79]
MVPVVVGTILEGFGAAIMGSRLYLRRHRGQPFDRGDYVTMFCILCVVYGMIAPQILVAYGTAWDMSDHPHAMTPEEIERRRIATKMILADQAIYAVFLWAQKAIVLFFVDRVLGVLPWLYTWIRVYWGLLFLSFAIVLAAVFTQCQPLHLYWQIVPIQSCIVNRRNFRVFVLINVATDALLTLLPLPWIIQVKRPWSRRLGIVGVFSTGIFLVGIGMVRYPFSTSPDFLYLQSFWIPFEGFMSVVVAHVPTIYSLRHPRTPDPPPPIERVPREGVVRSAESIMITRTVDVGNFSVDDRTMSLSLPSRDERLGSDEHLVPNRHG